MAVRRILLRAAIRARRQRADDRRQLAAAGNDLVEDDHSDVEPGAQHLRLSDMIEVVVRDLVRQDPRQVPIVSLLEEPGGDLELTAARVRRVDVGVVDDGHAHLAQGPRMVHHANERHHQALQALRLSEIDGLPAGRPPRFP